MAERGLWLVLLIGLLISSGAEAHRLSVFAAAEGDRIVGSAYFAGGHPAQGARVLIQDEAGTVLATMTPDPSGRFSYQVRAPTTYLVVVEGGDGHRAEWRVGADEFAGAGAVPAAEPPSPSVTPVSAAAVDGDVVSPALLAAIETAVARQVRPLREELAAAEERVRLHDVLGGLGWILGLAGLGLWWTRRRRRPT